MPTRSRSLRWVLTGALLLAAAYGCFGGRVGGGPAGPGAAPQEDTPRATGLTQATTLYRSAGLFAGAEPLPFVGSIYYLATPAPDSAFVLVTLSLPNRALTFTTDGEGQRAGYTVTLTVHRGADTVQQHETHEAVRVASFKETSRGDESVIFERFLRLPPGPYRLTLAVRDDGSTRSGSAEAALAVPRFVAGGLSSPVPVYAATPRATADTVPRLIANPRATAILGRDSVTRVYLEGYGLAPDATVVLSTSGDEGGIIWSDTVPLARTRALNTGVFVLPVGQIGVGRLTLAASVIGSAAAVRTPVFVSFGESFVVASLDEMLTYLRFFASPERLAALRNAAPEARGKAWMTFWAETDPVPSTAEHEGLRDYFARLQMANERFREEGGPGWLTDRGRVFVTWGEPDQIYERGDNALRQRGRTQIWVYNQHQTQLLFVDRTGYGQWRLTPASEAEFATRARRLRAAARAARAARGGRPV